MTIDCTDEQLVSYQAQGAFILYTSGQSHESSLARYHPIEGDAGGARLGAGQAVTSTLIAALLELLDNRQQLAFIPENVVASGRSIVAWYEPAQPRRMFFAPGSDKAVKEFDGKVIPQPALLFLARQRKLHVYALADDRRPNLETPLYAAPYWNVYDHEHNVCIGSMPLPDRVDPLQVSQWSKTFFRSNFTHHSGGKRWKRGTYAELLADAITRGSFNPDQLVPLKQRLGDLCKVEA